MSRQRNLMLSNSFDKEHASTKNVRRHGFGSKWRTFLVLFLLSNCGSFVSLAIAEEWPQFRGPNRDGRSAQTGILENIAARAPELFWMETGVGRGYSSVAVSDGRIFTTGNDSNGQFVSAIKTSDGKLVWRQSITESIPEHDYEGARSTPTVDGNLLFTVGSNGSIHCLRTSDGQPVWNRSFTDWKGRMMTGWGNSESPLVDGDLVLCTPGSDSHVMVALNKVSGEEVWSCDLKKSGLNVIEASQNLREGAGYSSIMISEGGGVRQYITLTGRGVIGVRAADGKLLWHYSKVANTVANIPTVIVEGDFVFGSTGYDTGAALLRLSGQADSNVSVNEEYFLDSKVFQNKHGGMVYVDGYIYCGHGNGSGLPICIEMQSGKVAWGPVRGAGRGEASVAYADGMIIFRFEDGTISFVRATPDKYEEIRSFMPIYQEGESWAYPAIADGYLYLREQDHVMSYKLD